MNNDGIGEVAVHMSNCPPVVFETCKSENVLAGFKKCGISPLDRTKVLDRLPKTSFTNTSNQATNTSESSIQEIDDVFKELLKNLRQGSDLPKTKKEGLRFQLQLVKEVLPKILTNLQSHNPNQVPVPVLLPLKKGAPKTTKKKMSAPSSEDDSSDYSLQDSDDNFRISESDEGDDQLNISLIPIT
ncbi:hypothetical protein J6590_070742 [Homalodisca vitripennis]|nr:hypothetical protein J6590_070742 [Homalodisca vitripennis]